MPAALLLACGVLLSGTHTTFLKIYQRKNGATVPVSLLFTGIMTATIGIASLITLFVSGGSFSWNLIAILLAAVMGILYTINLPLGAVAYTLGSLALSGVFLSLGSLLIPFLYGAIFLGELGDLELPSRILRLIGLAIALSTIFLQLPKKSEKSKISLKFFFIGLTMMMVNGIFCTLIKVQAKLPNSVEKPQVLFFAGVFGALTSLLILLFLQIRAKTHTRTEKNEGDLAVSQTPFSAIAAISDKKTLILPAIYGVFNGAVNLINLFLGDLIPATVQFPVLSCGSLLVTTLCSFFIFRDKLTKKNIVTILLCCTTILCFSF